MLHKTDRRLCGLAVLLSIGAVLSVFTVDTPVVEYFARHQLQGDVRRLVNWAELFAHGLGVLIIALLIASLDRRGRLFVPRLCYLAYAAGLANNLVKLLVTRLRPSAFLELPHHEAAWQSFLGFPGSFGAASHQSFPSGHTATAIGLAIAMSRVYPRGIWVWWLFAGLAAFQRVAERAHFVSDVLAAAAVACFVAALLANRLFWDADYRSIS